VTRLSLEWLHAPLAFSAMLRAAGALMLSVAASAQGALQPPLAPAENVSTPAKVVLGKALFWEEQLSSSGRVACGTCHLPEHGGGDSRRRRHPGGDGVFLTLDDTFGSPGIERRDVGGAYVFDAAFGLGEQVTPRAAPGILQAAWFQELFWDGRVDGVFVDPITGATQIAQGGALESLALHPLQDEVEMSRPQRGWSVITQRLIAVTPLALASDLPPDLEAALLANGDYPSLFAAAFGDPSITPARIAMALASYMRALVADQTPWDLYVQGQSSALTPQQILGLDLFENEANCAECHTVGLFSDGQFRSLGLTPANEDPGRGGVTGLASDNGKFKVPSLRNAALKSTFMHNGRFTSMLQVVNFYRNGAGTAAPPDPSLSSFSLDPLELQQLIDFLENGLVDPRVRDGLPPFDRPTLFSEVEQIGGNQFGAATSVGGYTPSIWSHAPPYLGNAEWGLGFSDGPPGAIGLVVVDFVAAPAPGTLVVQGVAMNVSLQAYFALPLALDATGLGTLAVPIPPYPVLSGLPLFAQGLFPHGGHGWSGTAGASLVLH